MLKIIFIHLKVLLFLRFIIYHLSIILKNKYLSLLFIIYHIPFISYHLSHTIYQLFFIIMFSGAPEWKVDTDPANNDYLKTPLENSELKLSCPARGKPRPDTLWYKDGEPYSSASERVSSRSFSDGQSSLDQQLHMSRLKSNVTNVAYVKNKVAV